MSWSKVNLVTQKDSKGMYDLYRCSKCGHQKKYYSFVIDGWCPKCHQKEKENEIYGCWSHINRTSYCLHCGDQLIVCPKEGHLNSGYWRLQRYEDEQLLVCPNNCPEHGRFQVQFDFSPNYKRKEF